MSPGRGVLHQNPFILEKNSARRLPQLGSIIYKVYLNSILFGVTDIVFVHYGSMQKLTIAGYLLNFQDFYPSLNILKHNWSPTQLVCLWFQKYMVATVLK